MSDDWYKRDVRSAIKGMSHLTLEERGAYNTLIDHQYLMGGPLPDNDAAMAGFMGVDVRVWRRLKKQLLAKDRIRISGGRIEDVRASCELAARQAQRTKRVAAGQLGGIASGKSRKSAASTEASASTPSNQRREDKKREESTPTPSQGQGSLALRSNGDNPRSTGGNPRHPANPNGYTPEFEHLYALGPRKGAKADAWKHYRRLLKSKQATHEDLLAAWQAYLAELRLRKKLDYVKLLRTFLSDETWREHLPAAGSEVVSLDDKRQQLNAAMLEGWRQDERLWHPKAGPYPGEPGSPVNDLMSDEDRALAAQRKRVRLGDRTVERQGA